MLTLFSIKLARELAREIVCEFNLDGLMSEPEEKRQAMVGAAMFCLRQLDGMEG